MKRIVTLLMATLLFAACQPDEPAPAPQPTSMPSLAGTAWVGTIDDTYMGYPMTITYNLDFLDDSTGSLYIEILVTGQTTPIRLLNHSTSTYIGWQYFPATSNGTLTVSGHTVPFTYDAATDVISCVINGRIHFGDESVTVGGPLEFRQL